MNSSQTPPNTPNWNGENFRRFFFHSAMLIRRKSGSNWWVTARPFKIAAQLNQPPDKQAITRTDPNGA